MRLISLQENLKRGLSIVGHITTKNINLPILNNILIRAEKGNIDLISTNLEIGVTSQLRGKIDEDGEFTVDSKLITEYVSLLKGEENVKIELSDNSLKVECGSYKTKIKGEPAKEFPLIPTISKKQHYQCSLEDLKKSLAAVVFAVSSNENRLELTGVLFSFDEEKLSLVATDSYRLAEKITKIKLISEEQATSESQHKLIVPAKTIQELLRILNNYSDPVSSEETLVKIYVSDNQILFSFDSVELISRLISGQYPDYKQIIPTKSQTSALIDRQELIRAIKAAALFSKTGINDVTLKLTKNKITISSFSGASGESVIEVDGEISGDDNEITINFRYLIDGLNNIGGERVSMSLLNANTPCLLRPENGDDYLYIVMPIRQ